MGITAGPDGNLWFTELIEQQDRQDHDIGIVYRVPHPNLEQRALRHHRRARTATSGSRSYSGNKIGKITTSGSITEYPIPTSSSYPIGITAGPDGNLWFTEGEGNKIGRLLLVPGPTVTAINPKTGINNAKYAVEVLGTNFQAASQVRLQQGTTVINGEGVVLAAPGRLTCYLDLNSKPLGKYDVFVTTAAGEGKLTGGFTVVNVCGQGAGASISLFAGLVGLLSVVGLGRRRRRPS